MLNYLTEIESLTNLGGFSAIVSGIAPRALYAKFSINPSNRLAKMLQSHLFGSQNSQNNCLRKVKQRDRSPNFVNKD